MSSDAQTIHTIIRQARGRFEQAGIERDSAVLEADLLARHALGGWDRGQLIANWHETPPPSFAEAFALLVRRRAHREPAAYITGTREFWNIDIEVAPGVLVPRPETEFIVEELLARFGGREASPELSMSAGSLARDGFRTCVCGPVLAARTRCETGVEQSKPVARAFRLADVGTGSGCLAVALARWLPGAGVVVAIDTSEEALRVAQRNITRHDVADRVALVRGDLLAPVEGPFDAIVSNPPYVPTAELVTLQPEIRAYEPVAALDGGPDGLDVIRQLVPQAASRLADGGWLVFEFGFGQAAGVSAIIEAESRLHLEAIRDDLAGIPRVAVSTRREKGR
ncbi:MAG: HemK/PrmC family methyltransferase [Acidobacteriota bacterium]